MSWPNNPQQANIYHPNSMVNGSIYVQQTQQGYISAAPLYIYQQPYPGSPAPYPVYHGITHPQLRAPQPTLNAPVPPPLPNQLPSLSYSETPPSLPYPPETSLFQYVGSHQTATKRERRPLPIIDPNTKKDVLTEFQNKESTLRDTAEEFIPSSQCTQQTEDFQSTANPETEHIQELSAQDTVDLNESFESNVLEAGLSFENKELKEDNNPSLSASIKQIPTNLELKLNQDDEIQLTSNFKKTILPEKQESHLSLPDRIRDESHQSRKRSHEQYSQSPPVVRSFTRFEQFNFQRNFRPRHLQNNQRNENQYPDQNVQQGPRRPFNGVYNNYRNCYRTQSERNLSMTHSSQSTNHQNRPHHVINNSDPQKIDQECTAHPIKDLNQNYIISEPEKQKETKYDENNNEIIEESVNLTESSLLESTADNSETSLNQSWKYSTQTLRGLKKSPLVLTKPPKIEDKNGLLDSSMNRNVWSFLFDKKHQINEDSNEDNNSSLQHNKSSSHLKKTNSTSRYENNQNQITRNRSGSEKQLIKMNLSLKDDVKLNEAENAWKPSHMEIPKAMDDKDKELAGLLKNFRSLLNKITEENFEHLIQEINDKKKYTINTTEKLSEIVKLLFEKSISEPGYASTYAKLCQRLSHVHLIDEELIAAVKKKTSNPWKIYLITHCQQEFERTKTDDVTFKELQDKISNASDAEEIENLEDVYFKLRQRANGTVKFIGELYKIDMLTASIMLKCIDVLLNSVTEENIERLCKLLTTIGEKFERELNNKNSMNKIMAQLSTLRKSAVITTQRIKFDIMNVLDLRASGWRQRENARSLETKPQKLQDLQEQENKKKRLMQQQLNDYQPRSNHNNHNNSLGRQRSQRSFESDGFKVKQLDFNKINIPKTNDAEMSLGPPRNLFQNFTQKQVQPPSTGISNTYANLSTDCDDVEQLPTLHRTRSGSFNKNNRKDKKNGSQSHGNNNNNNREKPKVRSPSPVIEKSTNDDDGSDDFFMIDLTSNEEKDMKLLTDKMQQTFKGKITFDMLVADLKKIKITKNVLGQVFTDLFDKKSNERNELIELIAEICRKGLITKVVNIDALKLAIKSIPTIICDVPLAYDYFADYCVYFYGNGLITKIEEMESICQNQQNALSKIKEKLKSASAKNESKRAENKKASEVVDKVSNDLSQLEISLPSKVNKKERDLQKIMSSIQYKLERKQKNANFLEEIYNLIDEENCQEASNFIQDLTLTILKNCYGKKSQKKAVDLTKMFPLFTRYIDTDVSSQIDCINSLNSFAFSNPQIENCNLNKLFDLFYENDIISIEAFNFWKKENPNSPSKRKALNQTASFFTRLEEADISDDFNCTSSTIKED